MDASAYLKKQGWRGTGHSLDHTDRGIRKPLPLSKKVDVLGVGVQKYAAVSDQWWLRAYDQGLKDFGTGKESTLATAQKQGVNRGGLYARFVKGQAVPGTIGQVDNPERPNSPAGQSRTVSTQASERRTSTEQPPIEAAPRIVSIKPTSSETTGMENEYTREKRARKRKVEEQKKLKKMERAGFNADAAKRPRQEVDWVRHRVKGFVDEAVRRGIIPPKSGGKPIRERSVPPTEQDMSAVIELVSKLPDIKKTGKPKADKIAREGRIRDFKRVAVRYLESMRPSQEEILATKAAMLEHIDRRAQARQRRIAAVKEEQAKRKALRAEKKAQIAATARAQRERAAKQKALNQDRAASEDLPVDKGANGEVDDGFRTSQNEIKLDQGPDIDNTRPRKKQVTTEGEAESLGFVVDTVGDSTIVTHTDEPVPLDPSLWKGKVVKELPKAVRKARRDWMALRRAERKGTTVNSVKAKGVKKIEAREAFVKEIMKLSRDAKKRDDPGAKVTVQGIQSVPVIQLESSGSKFSKTEIGKARALARKMIKRDKKEKKELKGRGRGRAGGRA